MNAPFDQEVDAYEAWFYENPAAYASELLAVRRVVPPSGRVLEVGVGTGRFSAPLKIPLGVDPSLPMLAMARRRGTGVAAAAGEALPVRDGSLDAVLLVTTLCFLNDPAAAVVQARRALKPAGLLACAFIDADSPLGRRYRELKSRSRFYREARFFKVEEVRGLMEGGGFTVREIHQTLTAPPASLREPEPPRPGFGEGSFVVIAAARAHEPPRRRNAGAR
jgi:SAM-dependent methyltransferase